MIDRVCPYSRQRAERAQRMMAYARQPQTTVVSALHVRAEGAGEAISRENVSARLPRRFAPAFIAVSLADLVLTWVILNVHLGSEANPIANLILSLAGFPGLTLFKASVVSLVLLTTQAVLTQSPIAARRLAFFAVGISAVPVVWSLHLLLSFRWFVWLEGGAL